MLRGGYSFNYVNDEFLVALTGNGTTNAGLRNGDQPDRARQPVSAGFAGHRDARLSSSPTFSDNYNLSPTTSFGMADPNLRTPYVQQWNYRRAARIKRRILLEARYVGNHGTKLLRAIDLTRSTSTPAGF